MTRSEIAARVRAAVSADQVVAELGALVRLETPSQDPVASARIAAVLTEAWEPFGTVRSEVTAVGTHLLIEVPGAGAGHDGAPILLVGHSDTVWPLGSLADLVPWSQVDGVVRGPGAYDMKSGLVVIRTAVATLTALGLDHPPLRIFIGADEEVGSGSSTPLVREACRGVRAALGFESPHPDGSLKVGRLGSTRAKLKVTGRESHAALDPEAGINAIEELVDQLLTLRGQVAEISARRPGEVLVNVGGVTGGGRTNVVPGAAEALIGFRFATAAAEAEVLAAINGLRAVRPGAELAVEILSSRPAWQAGEGDATLLAAVSDLAAAAGQPLGGRPAAGAADTNTTGALGVPTLDGLGPRGGGAHAVSEHILIDSFVDRVVLLATVLAGLE